ncbi:MAG: nucleotidyltransferase substrate binding protein [Bdellovibrio sp.]|nr:nucleotidyltransferase substrate binding protein [Bdellovibrio sp.]
MGAFMDVRWIQRLENFSMALKQLEDAAALFNQRPLSDLEKQGVIQAFEFTHELAWNVIRDYFEYQGNVSINGSRDASREAFQKKLITDGDSWMEMIKSRNLTSHTYNKGIAKDIVDKVFSKYLPAFQEFTKKMESLKS